MLLLFHLKIPQGQILPLSSLLGFSSTTCAQHILTVQKQDWLDVSGLAILRQMIGFVRRGAGSLLLQSSVKQTCS